MKVILFILLITSCYAKEEKDSPYEQALADKTRLERRDDFNNNNLESEETFSKHDKNDIVKNTDEFKYSTPTSIPTITIKKIITTTETTTTSTTSSFKPTIKIITTTKFDPNLFGGLGGPGCNGLPPGGHGERGNEVDAHSGGGQGTWIFVLFEYLISIKLTKLLLFTKLTNRNWM